MRRWLLFCIAAVVVLAGCRKEQGTADDKDFVIATSFYPMYIHVLNIAGGIPGVTVVNVTPPMTGCLHDYQLTPADLKRLEAARVFVINGAGMESFIEHVARRNPGLAIIEASKGIDCIKDHHGGCNPHLWVSVSLAIRQVQSIAEQLAAVDPDRAARYRANADRYAAKLEELKKEMHAALDRIPKRPVVTFHEAFPYLTREFGIEVAAVIEREPGTEPGAGEMAEIIRIVKQRGVRVIYAEPQYPARSADTIARETGAKVHTLDPAVTGPMEPDAYLAIMRRNLKVLKETLP